MKSFLVVFGLLLAATVRCEADDAQWPSTGSNTPAVIPLSPRPLPAGSYYNPILAGYYPDPSVTRVGDKYYLVNSTFAHFPGIPIHESTDLVHWKLIGHALSNSQRRPPSMAWTSRAACSRPRSTSTRASTTSSTRWWKPAAISSSPPPTPGAVVRSCLAQGDRRHRSLVLLRRRWQGVRRQQRAARRRPALRGSSRHLDPAVRHRA